MEIEVNPAGVEDEYLASLNRCFGHWGDARMFDWCFRRPGAPPADLLVGRAEGELVAGSAVTYRTLVLPNGRRATAGIITGSWTLPEARGRGAFSRLAQACVRAAAARGAPVTLAWSTLDNPSTRGMERVGAAQFKTAYVSSAPETPVPDAGLPVIPVEDPEAALEAMLAALSREAEGFAHVGYTPAEWRAQFLGRPGTTELLAIGDAGWSVVERSGEWDRVQVVAPVAPGALEPCVAALLRRAALGRRRLFAFTTVPRWMECFGALGLEMRPGRLSVFVGDPLALGALTGGAPRSELDASHLGDPADVAYLGRWHVQSGDRM